MTEETEEPAIDTAEDAATEQPGDLSRPQKRLLKRLYNARTVPVMVDERPFLTYREAVRYLLSLGEEARESAYTQMKAHVRDKVR
jgi:hypothetical protein